jgi:hypothetical protein
VTTQGSAHEHSELDQLDQLPSSVVELIEQQKNGAIDDVAMTEHSELNTIVDVDRIDGGNRQVQPTDEPAIDLAAGELLVGAPAALVDAIVPHKEEKPSLAAPSSEDDVVPQASGNMLHAHHHLTCIISLRCSWRWTLHPQS